LDNGASPDDYELMIRIARREPGALALLYDRHGALVYTIGLRMLRDRSETEEFVSDVFLEIWRRPERYDANRAAPITYLVTIARSRAIDRQRSAAFRATNRNTPDDVIKGLPSLQDGDPSQQASQEERCQQVRAAVGQLDPAQRQVVEMAFFDGLTHSQIAAKLGKPLGTVKTFIRQGLIRLRDEMRKD
jgi:RNA polymerase sigma-70 factor (ECF subfamily)